MWLSLLCACVIVGVTSLHVHGQSESSQFGWVSKAPIPGARTAGVALTGRDGNIYVFGGTDGTQNFASAEVYLPGTNSWRAIAPLPLANSYMAGAVGADGKMYLIGGWDGSTSQNIVMAYDPASNTYACSFSAQRCASSTLAGMPTARGNLAVVVGTSGLIYAIGGFTDVPVATVEVYDPASNQWGQATPLPHPSAGPSATVNSDGTIVVVGGFDGQNYLNTTYAGHPGQSAQIRNHAVAHLRPHFVHLFLILWLKETYPELFTKEGQAIDVNIGLAVLLGLAEGNGDSKHVPQLRSHVRSPAAGATNASSVEVDVVLGGANGASATNSVWIYDPSANRWYQGFPMPTAREAAMVTVGLDGTVYVIGGDDGSGTNVFSSMDAWIPAPSPTAIATGTLAPTSTASPPPTATPAPPTATPTSAPTFTPTPLPAVTKTVKCPKNSTKKNGKCACKKGYVKKKGKCVKKPRR